MVGDYADQMFKMITAFAISKNLSSPYIGLDGQDASKAYAWLDDAMQTLIERVLGNDPILN